MPDRIASEGPPSRAAVTISWTCLECELVKTLVNSGMRTAARVPQLMIVASCHHRWPCTSPPTFRSLISRALMPNDVVMHRIEAIQIKRVNGCSKSNSFRPAYFFSEILWLMKYDTPD